ncbi:MAG: T9SS type A sorting domain-containing protein [Bacteroidota bacterium]
MNYAHMFRSGDITTSREQEQIASRVQLKAFPNPVRDKLHVNFELEQPQTITISLKNVIGQELIHKSLTPAGGFQQHSLDLSGVGAGYYLLTIETPQGVATRKIQVQ